MEIVTVFISLTGWPLGSDKRGDLEEVEEERVGHRKREYKSRVII